MDLWIRSQNREKLVKINDKIYCEHSEEPLDEYGDVLYCCDISTDADTLGTYSTEERALEVLDEIQKLLVGDLLVFTNTDFEEGLADYVKPYKSIAVHDTYNPSPRVEFAHRDCIVYEMPKE